MNFHVLTLFPEMIENGMNTSITGRAIAKGLLTLEAVNIRDFAFNKHQKVDDYTYGGGAGMLMQAEPVYQAYSAVLEKIKSENPEAQPRVVYLSPQGGTFSQEMAEEYGITPRKTASLLDTFSCVFQGVIPYGAQMLVAISAVNELGGEISAFQIMPKLFYPLLLLLSSLITIMKSTYKCSNFHT